MPGPDLTMAPLSEQRNFRLNGATPRMAALDGGAAGHDTKVT
jgi:hypothetical protein